jgi:hypothetical protein
MKLQVIISEKEGAIVKELAKKDNRSVSGYVRKILLDKLGESEDGTANLAEHRFWL